MLALRVSLCRRQLRMRAARRGLPANQPSTPAPHLTSCKLTSSTPTDSLLLLSSRCLPPCSNRCHGSLEW